MRPPVARLLLLCSGLLLTFSLQAQHTTVAQWLTTADRAQLLTEQAEHAPLQPRDTQTKTIEIRDEAKEQSIDGFGFALTGGSAQLIHAMDPAARHKLLEEIFGRGPGQDGVSYLRVSIGASDMNDHVFTYDDTPAGTTDPALQHFTLAEDEKDLIPVLREILTISPRLPILASPWTAPSWMKTNGAPKGGHLKPEFYGVYAQYFVRYLQAMQAHGIPVAAITMQNEPLNPKNTPSMVLDATEEGAFLRDALGPALRSAGLTQHVILFDHNCNHPDYPISILDDPKARVFADGSGFHLYEGDISALSTVHDAYPQKNLYFTEQMVIEEKRDGVLRPVADPVARVVIGAMRNWSRNVLLWNLAADPSFGPHTPDGGCPICQGAITIDSSQAPGHQVTRNIAFYTIAHASRFVPPGSVRVDSTEADADLANVAWRTPGGGHVLLVTNTGTAARSFTVGVGQQQFSAALDAGSVSTFVW